MEEKKEQEHTDDYEEKQTFLKQQEPDLESQDRFPPIPNLEPPPPATNLSNRFWISTIINTTATAGIVFINKKIFTHPRLHHVQLTFAAFHFTITFLLLYLLSSRSIALFPRRPLLNPLTLLPLALAMIFNVVLPNASLAFSSIQFYQVARVLLTPCVAGLNFLLYGKKIGGAAVASLGVVCLGVGVVSWFDTKASVEGGQGQVTRPLGVGFAFLGVWASSFYTVWIKAFHERLGCSSMQLLMGQAPVSVAVMVYLVPFVDDVGVWREVEGRVYGLILISGFLACLINLSQFVIINEAGPVSSTVVGHFKTCTIVAMGWIVSGKALTDGSLVGIVLAIGGIIAYSFVTQTQARK